MTFFKKLFLLITGLLALYISFVLITHRIQWGYCEQRSTKTDTPRTIYRSEREPREPRTIYRPKPEDQGISFGFFTETP